MKKSIPALILIISLMLATAAIAADTFKLRPISLEIDSPLLLAQNLPEDDWDDDDFEDVFDVEIKDIWDPLEPVNRVFFFVNDKFYFWLVKPAATGYNFIVPEMGRTAVNRFFLNIRTPIRFVNSLLQFKIKAAGTELARLLINTTIGIGGFTDPAASWWNIKLKKEDTGQTIGFYRLGPGFYIVWPLLGPSSLRDSVGMVGDHFLDPISWFYPDHNILSRKGLEGNAYTPSDRKYWRNTWSTGIKVYDKFNYISLNLGFYEDIKKDALDPYTFIRDAYHQHREKLISE